ncbi:heme biosynthesis protein HemY [Pontibaca methylaminivorans]|uniref:heme biosynthesis protein HemY n=1 Tax=Pontibaca methylaminivorans TaxID=515897 RepID=UPI002FDB096C
MLWSLIKILLFIAVIGALALGASHLMDIEGGVQVTMAGTEYTFGPLHAVIALLLLVVAVWLLLLVLSGLVAFLRFLKGDETALSRRFERKREKRGLRAVTEAVLALASGEGRAALKEARRVEKYLDDPALAELLKAQAAELSGETALAAESYRKLIENDHTRFVGVRGALRQRLAKGDRETARRLAEKALALKPAHEETQDILLRLQAQAHDWAGARQTLSAKRRSGTIPKDVYTRRDAVLALSEARDVIRADAGVAAQERAIEANRLSPDLIPAAVMAARAYIAQDQQRKAAKVIRKAWEVRPHPDLAAAFAEIRPDETPQERLARFEALTRTHPYHQETRLLRAELNIAAEDFPEARRALGDLTDGDADARAFTLMAAVARGEGASDSVVEGWLTRALNAPRGPRWICENCQHVHAEWAPICSNCQSFDTLSWKASESPRPGGDVPASVVQSSLLPLIVGRDPGPDSGADAGPDIGHDPGEGPDPEPGTGGVPDLGPIPEANLVDLPRAGDPDQGDADKSGDEARK